MNEGVEKYIAMQRDCYDNPANVDKDLEWFKFNIVTNPDSPHIFLKEECDKYYKGMFGFIDHTQHFALDFGCGCGRLIAGFADKFFWIDGVDLSAQALDHARTYLEKCGVDNYTLYQCNGYDLRNLQSNHYDVVYSVLVLEHICVHEIRDNYFREFFRVLKPGGYILIIMKGGNQYKEGHKPSSSWYENSYDALTTNSQHDVRIENLFDVSNDLLEIGYHGINFGIIPAPNEAVMTELAGHQYAVQIKAYK